MNCSSKNSFTSKRTALNWITFQLNFAEFIMRLMKWNTWARIYICRCWRCKICVLNLFMLFFSPLVKVRWKNSLCSAEKSRFSLAYFFFVSSFNFRKNSLFFSNKIRFCALFSIDEHEICCLFLLSFFCHHFSVIIFLFWIIWMWCIGVLQAKRHAYREDFQYYFANCKKEHLLNRRGFYFLIKIFPYCFEKKLFLFSEVLYAACSSHTSQ